MGVVQGCDRVGAGARLNGSPEPLGPEGEWCSVPALAKIRVRTLADLAGQLRYTPKKTLRTQIERAEALASEIEPSELYSVAWIVARVTGRETKDTGEDVSVPGEALLSDLSALVERLCEAAHLEPDEVEAEALGVEELASRWGVSRRTIERYRRQGLIARRVRDADGKTRLLFRTGAVERFESRSKGRISKAASFTRIDPKTREAIVRRAHRYKHSLGWSMNQAAERLAEKYGRTREGVRRVLLAHDRDADEPVFAPVRPGSREDGARALEMARLGVEPSEIAETIGRTTRAMRRAMLVDRLHRLLELEGVAPEQGRRQPSDLALGHPMLTHGLGDPGETILSEFVRKARASPPMPPQVERLFASGAGLLVRRAMRARAEIDRHQPEATALDSVETDLLWAARLRVELLRPQWVVMLRVLDDRLGRPAEHVRSEELSRLLEAVFAAACHAAGAFDPERGGRLAARVTLEADRAARAVLSDHPVGPQAEGRATPRLSQGGSIADWTRRVAPWQAWLEPDPRVPGVLDRLDEGEREILRLRYGLGPKPRTIAALAEELGVAASTVSRRVRGAVRAAIEVAGADSIRP